jgi:hypothetical protein
MISHFYLPAATAREPFESCRWVFEKRVKEDPEKWIVLRKFYVPFIRDWVLRAAIKANFITANGRDNNPTEFDYNFEDRTMTQLDRMFRVRYITKEQYDATQEDLESC